MQFKKVFVRSAVAFIMLLIISTFMGNVAYATDSVWVNDSTGYKLIYRDEAGLIRAQKEDTAIIESMKPITEYGNVGFIVTDDIGKSGTNYFKQEYYNCFGEESGIIFFIDMFDRNLYIWTDGAVGDEISISDCNTITDNVFRYAREGDYSKTAQKAFVQINAEIQHNHIPEPLKYISAALVAALVSLIGVYFIISLFNGDKAPSPAEWLENVKHNVEVKDPKEELVASAKIYSPRSSGSGGSFGGGFRGGGHGGGHHF